MVKVSLEEARQIHERILVFDGHNDTPVERVARGERSLRWMQEDADYNMDVPRMRRGGMDGGVFIVGNGPSANMWVTIEQVLAQVEQHGEALALVRGSQEVAEAKAAGRIAIMMGVEGAGRWLDGQLEIVSLLHRVGVRLLGITHGEGGDEPKYLQHEPSPSRFCEQADRDRARHEGRGLTTFGEQVLTLSNDLGLITDLSHINDRAFYQVLEQSRLPVTMTHTGAFALSPHWRCLTDDQIRALAEADGVIGIAFSPAMINRAEPTVDNLVKHVCYVANMVGIDHVAIGSDFDGLGPTTPVIPDASQLPRLTQSLLAHGLSEVDVAKVWGGNFMRLMRRTVDGPVPGEPAA